MPQVITAFLPGLKNPFFTSEPLNQVGKELKNTDTGKAWGKNKLDLESQFNI